MARGRKKNLAAPTGGQDATATRLPDRLAPMLAQLAPGPFDSDQHLFEIKWDGTRCIAFVEGGKLRLQNRRFNETSGRYPDLQGLLRLPSGTVLDGEIVVLHQGRPVFTKLQQRDAASDPRKIAAHAERMPATLMAFDLLFLRGTNLMGMPLQQRRAALVALVADLGDPHIVVPNYVVGPGTAYFSEVEKLGLEGVMAKRLDSPYLPGKRTSHWQKIKVSQVAHFTVLGYVQREGQQVISALLLGSRSEDRWQFKGSVGSGFSEPSRGVLYQKLCGLPPLRDPPADGPAGAVWKATNLRCVVRFAEETDSGKLRWPVFVKMIES